MGLTFRKSIKICKGVSLNVGKTGVGVTVNKNGLRYSLNTNGRTSVSVPKLGVGYTNAGSSSKRKSTSKRKRTYKSTAQKQKAEIAKKKAAAAKADEQEQNRLRVEEQDNYLDLIRSVHKECDDPIDWAAVRDAQPPFEKGKPGPAEEEAAKALANYTPGLGGMLFKSKAERDRKALEDAVTAAKAEDAEEYAAWEESVAYAKRILAGDTDAYLEALEEANPFEDFADYGSDLEFGTDRKNVMEIEFRVKSGEVIPEKRYSLMKTGKLSEKDFTKTEFYDIMQDYVCSCAVRLARELFAVLPVDTVLVHAVDGALDTSTGRESEDTILSVCFIREGFEDINFERIDPSDFVERFEVNMKFAKTTGFRPVERVQYEE
ncbi:MAG: DUF4236 domain-containing protein [Oscillospiraceae bacterium]|nr:DUF4236 domain-containing protein [Oscillospiraceae bacterium]